MKAIIMAGGKGTRLSTITNGLIPKPLVPILGKPLLQWQIEQLKEYDITDIMIVVGYLGDEIKKFFKDGRAFGVSIEYFEERQPLGSAGSLAYISEWINKESFMLIYGDILFSININKMLNFHKEKESTITLLVHPNSHPYDSDLVVFDKNNRVNSFNKKNSVRDFWYDNYVNAGIYVLEPNICDMVPQNTVVDFVHDVLSKCIENKERIYAYVTPEYVKDAGTPSRLREVEEAIKSGIVRRKNMLNLQKAVFLDRDGTLNKYKGLIYKVEDIELELNVPEAIKMLNSSEYLSIVITNQPSVARGLCNTDEIDEMHLKMKTLLGQEGAYLDKILYCPHHPDKGYPEENAKYKINCDCRKPNIGLLTEASKLFNINLQESWFVGDTTVDIMTGKNAGMRTILLQTGMNGTDGKFDVCPDFVCNTLLEAINLILGE